MFILFWLLLGVLMAAVGISPAWLLLPAFGWLFLIMAWMIWLSISSETTDRAAVIGVFAFGLFMFLLVTVAYPNALAKYIRTVLMRLVKGLT